MRGAVSLPPARRRTRHETHRPPEAPAGPSRSTSSRCAAAPAGGRRGRGCRPPPAERRRRGSARERRAASKRREPSARGRGARGGQGAGEARLVEPAEAGVALEERDGREQRLQAVGDAPAHAVVEERHARGEADEGLVRGHAEGGEEAREARAPGPLDGERVGLEGARGGAGGRRLSRRAGCAWCPGLGEGSLGRRRAGGARAWRSTAGRHVGNFTTALLTNGAKRVSPI